MADTTITMTAVTATPVTRDDLLARLRVELHDEDSDNYRWEDATLERHIDRAVRELSQVWPREQLTTLQTSAGSRDVDLTGELEDLVRVEAVEWPVGEYPPSYVQWSVYRTTLTLLVDSEPTEAADLNVYWGSLHLCDGSQSTVPAVAEDAVVMGASGYAALEWANFAINRANLAGTAAVDDYRAYGNAQLRRFQELLSDFGQRARVRVSGLFKASDGPAGRDVVRWEP
ncbi:MAG TPA: hypothetical protein VIB47_07520 [Dehalococcoidia bacterium]|jgi:hypothetical protein